MNAQQRLAAPASTRVLRWALLLVLALSSCRHPQPQPETRPQSRGLPEPNYAVVKVFYGTSRKPTGQQSPNTFYGSDRADLQYGTCNVSIPRDHRMGELERPSVLSFQFREDPALHITLLSVSPANADDFFDAVSQRVDQSTEKQLLLFVHGFDTSFADAAYRTAQLTYDLGYDGAPIFYSWPSAATLSEDAYLSDAAQAEWAADHLEQFLLDLQRKTGCERVQLIAHSMGNVALTSALVKVVQHAAADPAHPPRKFDQVFLAAPDIDARTFREKIAPAIVPAARQITLYASSRDHALLYSNALHDHQERTGEAFPSLVVVPGIQTIDASLLATDFVGHSYYASNTSVLSDLIEAINGKAIAEREHLEKLPFPGDPPGQSYWRFRAPAVPTTQPASRP